MASDGDQICLAVSGKNKPPCIHPSTKIYIRFDTFIFVLLLTTRTLKGTPNTDAKSKYIYDLKWTGNTGKKSKYTSTYKILPMLPSSSVFHLVNQNCVIGVKQARKPRSYTSPKLRLTDSLTHLLTGVKCRATSVAKN